MLNCVWHWLPMRATMQVAFTLPEHFVLVSCTVLCEPVWEVSSSPDNTEEGLLQLLFVQYSCYA